MKKYVIEKNIPILESEESKCPFAEMEIGDSFFISLIDWIGFSLFNGGLYRASNFYAPGKEFVCRHINEPTTGFHIWRVK